MTALDLREFLARTRTLVDTAPPSTRQETRAWLVDPLLETLGWDIHAESCRTDTTVDGSHFEYVCTIESIPALFVAIEPYSDSLDRERASAICQTMAWTGIDRAIYTNGRQLLFLAGTSDVEQFSCPLTAIDDHEQSVEHYTNARLSRRLERHSRHHVARQFAVERPALAEAIVDHLTAVGGPTYETEFESATDRFLEGLVASFATDDGVRPGVDDSKAETGISVQFRESVGTDSQPDETGLGDANGPALPEEDSVTRSRERSPADGEEAERAASPDAADDETSPDSTPKSDDGEYVVRFFNDRTSIGAIGHGSPEQALVHAAEYCFDRGLSGVTVPWPDTDESVDDSDGTILNENPTHADGRPMAAAEQLSNGLYLNTTGDAADHAARVEALASRAGLRAMVTGDWDDDRLSD